MSTLSKRIKSEELGKHIPSKILHVKALCHGLSELKSELNQTYDLVQSYSFHTWAENRKRVGFKLTSSTVLLEGFMDGLIIASLEPGTYPKKVMSFQNTRFTEDILQEKQEHIKQMKTYKHDSQTEYADFWTIANFWKHYYPSLPEPTFFTRQNCMDFELNLGNVCSGPILHDLILPVFHTVCQIVVYLATQHELPEKEYEDLLTPIK